MNWNRWYSLRSYIKSSLWVVPVIVLIFEVVVKRLSERLGGWMVSRGLYDLKTGFLALSTSEAHALLDRIFNLSMSCLVFTFGSLLVAIQVAGGQYTPRIIATTLLRDNVIRRIIGLFVFTLLWANRTMVQLGNTDSVPQLQVLLAMLFALASLISFIILIDYAAKLLRPVSLVGRVGEKGLAVIHEVYPEFTENAHGPMEPARKHKWDFRLWGSRGVTTSSVPEVKRGLPDRVLMHSGKSGIVLAVNLKSLVAEARRTDSVIEFIPQVGDFVSVDEPLFHVYGNAEAIDDRKLQTLVALGSERTMEQDPMFAFRIEVDIALKALSPAINDPTTAVLAIDQLHRLLKRVGERSLHSTEIKDPTGKTRVIFRTPDWDDFVHISFREIRYCGADSLQVVRRLRAMVESLVQSLPAHRHPALLLELELLDRSVKQRHLFPEDLALAQIPDSQGMGGSIG